MKFKFIIIKKFRKFKYILISKIKKRFEKDYGRCYNCGLKFSKKTPMFVVKELQSNFKKCKICKFCTEV